jgi:hypothetical protein
MAFSVAAETILQKIKPGMPQSMIDEIMAEAKRQALNDVYGVGHKTDARGNPIEMGIGSPSNMTEQALVALEKAEGKIAADRAREAAARNKK